MGRRHPRREGEGQTFVVGVSKIVIEMSGMDNLKEKRSVVSKIRDRILDRYNVAFAEVGPQDVYDEAVFGVAAVSNDRGYVERVLGTIPEFIDTLGVCRVLSEDMAIELF